MRPLRVQVGIGADHEQRCRHTETAEGKMCCGCVRAIIDHLLGLVQAATSSEEALALGLVEQGLLRLDTQLAGISALIREQHGERRVLGGLTEQELSRVRVYGYTVQELGRAVTILRELGIEHRIRPGGEDQGSTSSTGRWRRR